VYTALQLASASIINYRNTDKPVCFVLNFAAFVTQAKNSMKSISAIHPAITENMKNTLMKRALQRLIIGKPISQYTLYSAMFCPLHSNIGKEQHEKYLCNPSSHYGKYKEYAREMCPITENTENILVKCAPYLDT